MNLWRTIYADYRRYRASGAGSALGVILFTQGFWATFVFRICHCLSEHARLLGLRQLVRFGCIMAQKATEVITGISLPPQCSIGPGLYIGHFGPIILHPEVRLGANCNLSQGVTIGVAGRAARRGCPILGDRVYVGAGAIVFGNINVGNDVAIGAGAVVAKSAPARAVVAGNPAKTISYGGSFEFVRYDAMEKDPERREALNARATDSVEETRAYAHETCGIQH